MDSKMKRMNPNFDGTLIAVICQTDDQCSSSNLRYAISLMITQRLN